MPATGSEVGPELTLILLLELSCEMALDERGLPCTERDRCLALVTDM
jgi:hypothetical protein